MQEWLVQLSISAFSKRCWWVVEHATSLHPPFCSTTDLLIHLVPLHQPTLKSEVMHELSFSKQPTLDVRTEIIGIPEGRKGWMFTRQELMLIQKYDGEFSYMSTLLYLIWLSMPTAPPQHLWCCTPIVQLAVRCWSGDLSTSTFRMMVHIIPGPYNYDPPSPPFTNDDDCPPLPPQWPCIPTTPCMAMSANAGCWQPLVFPAQWHTQCQTCGRLAMWDTTTTTKGN